MKRRNCLLTILLFALWSINGFGQDIIPVPVQYQPNDQEFTLSETTKIYFSEGLEQQAGLLESALSPATGWDLDIEKSSRSSDNVIFLK